MKLSFEKDCDGRWYIVLDCWDGDKSELEMVAGADVMLDTLSDGSDVVTLLVDTDEPPRYDVKLELTTRHDIGCASYSAGGFPVWLCDVTLFVLGEFPEVMYVTKTH